MLFSRPTRNHQFVLILSLLGVFWGSQFGFSQETYTLSGDNIALFNLAGEVHLVGTQESDILVEVTRGGTDAEQLDIQTGTLALNQVATETLRVVYPAEQVIYARQDDLEYEVLVRPNGVFYDGVSTNAPNPEHRKVRLLGQKKSTGQENELEAHADLTIHIPEGKQVRICLVAGEISASHVHGDLCLDGGVCSVHTAHTQGPLSIDTCCGPIQVEDATGPVVSTDTGAGSITISQCQANVEADTGAGDVTLNTVNGETITVDSGAGSIRISDAQGKLSVETGSGGIFLQTIRSETISVDSGSGAIEINDTDGVLNIETGSGAIRLQGIRAEHVSADSGTGNIVGHGVDSPNLSVSTGSGNIELDLLSDVDQVDLSTAVGNVILAIPDDLGATVELETFNGNVTTEFLVTNPDEDDDIVEVTLGDGVGQIHVDTTSGSVQLRAQ